MAPVEGLQKGFGEFVGATPGLPVAKTFPDSHDLSSHSTQPPRVIQQSHHALEFAV